MGVRLSIEGSESIKLQETSITGIEFGADIPHDSNARSTDLGSTVLITGKQRMTPASLQSGLWFLLRNPTVTVRCRSMW